ncbi:hypothetical protein SAMN05216553_11551 [Lentzea fradiae]|uniref:Uncharacterized protein n=1 Tax=Lentzea fradiae TaxID=200378 RepID=A0A1G7ZAU6_9PSEU|nr:hypothetical protein [Lentzea fradiae]SDH05230.1 hypothetical protein SAMN05216553_11551 [Lentzea fradiae]
MAIKGSTSTPGTSAPAETGQNDPPPATSSPEPQAPPEASSPPPSPSSPPPPSPPRPRGTPGPTGKSGFLVEESTLTALGRTAGNLESGYRGVSSKLAGLHMSWNALGMIGTPFVGALNGSNSKSVDNATSAADSFRKVQDNLKATAQTYRDNDANIAKQFSKFEPDTDGAASKARNLPSGTPPGGTTSAPAPQGGRVSDAPDLPGTTTTAGTTSAPAPQGGRVSDVPDLPGTTTTAAAPAPPPAPQGGQVPPVPGFTGVTAPAASAGTPPPAGGQVRGAPDLTGATNPAAHGPAGPVGGPAPGPRGGWQPPGGRGPAVAPPVTDTTNVTAMWPPAGPRPGSTPYVPGAAGPTQGIFAPNPPAADALRPIAAAAPPTPPPPPRPQPVAPPPGPSPRPGGGWQPSAGPGPAAPQFTDPSAGPRPGPVPGFTGPPQGTFAPNRPGEDVLKPIGDAQPPTEPRPPKPAPPDPFAPPPTPPPVKPVLAPTNILDLLDPRGYPDGHGHGSPSGYKTDAAWPATTIDGKPWADLQNLTPEESRKWIDNLRNVLASKPDGAFFWSGNIFDSEGNRISVMNEAEYMAKADGRNTLEGTLDDRAIKLPGWGNTSPEGKAVWDSVSASLAHGASGDVYVLLGPTRRPDNVFHMTEFPILQQNPNVSRVVAIDVLTKEETVIFSR